MSVRPPAVAGLFYPADPKKLRQEIQGFLKGESPAKTAPKALIGPHAGTIYSGPVAGTIYRTLQSVREKIQRVVLLGPSHYVAFHGVAGSRAKNFATPLGKIAVDQKVLQELEKFSQFQYSEGAHAREHSLEVHLPFLQEVLQDFKLIPLVVSQAEPKDVAEILEALWGDDRTLIVISSDLSHYLDYHKAQGVDQKTSEAILRLAPEEIDHHQACGYYPMRGFLVAAKRHKMTARLLDLRNSGDTAGAKDAVVGYGAYAFYENNAEH